jgi:hypothetical protein
MAYSASRLVDGTERIGESNRKAGRREGRRFFWFAAGGGADWLIQRVGEQGAVDGIGVKRRELTLTASNPIPFSPSRLPVDPESAVSP